MFRLSVSLVLVVASAAAQPGGGAICVPANTPAVGTCNVIPFGQSVTFSAGYTYVARIPASFMTPGAVVTDVAFSACTPGGTWSSNNVLIAMGHLPNPQPCPFNFPGPGGAAIGSFLDLTIMYDSSVSGPLNWNCVADTFSPQGLTGTFAWDGVNDVGYYMTYQNSTVTWNGAFHRSATEPTRTYAAGYQAPASTTCLSPTGLFMCLLLQPPPSQGTPGPIAYEMENTTVGNPGTYPPGWVDGGGQFPWAVNAGPTGSVGTGPESNNTPGGNNYLYCETSGPPGGSTFIIQAPPILVSGIVEPTLSFAYNMLFAGNPDGTLNVEYFDGQQWDQIFTRVGDQGPNWTVESLDIHQSHTLPVPGNRVLRVRFLFTSGTLGSSFQYDCAIDSVHFGPLDPDWQPNQPDARFTVNGVETTGQFQAVTTVAACGQPVPVNVSLTSVSGVAQEFYVHPGPGVSLENGGFVIGEGEIVNVNLALPGGAFLFGGLAPNPVPILPFITTFAAPNANLSLTAQALVISPECELGLCLSQAALLSVQSSIQGQGPTGDDSSVEAIFCAPIQFMGTLWTSCHISSNARILFGGPDTDFSPSVVEGLTDNPFFGAWTDLNPATGGNISFTISGAGIDVSYVGVPYFGETTPTNLRLSLDSAGTATIDVSGMIPNPLTGISISDAMFLGITGGNALGATDPGPTFFTNGGSGANGNPTDMIYDFVDFATAVPVVPGQINSITNLQNGQGLLIFTKTGIPGAYMWLGQ